MSSRSPCGMCIKTGFDTKWEFWLAYCTVLAYGRLSLRYLRKYVWNDSQIEMDFAPFYNVHKFKTESGPANGCSSLNSMLFYIESSDGSKPNYLNPPHLDSTSYYRLGLPPIEAYDEESAMMNRMARRIQIQWRECSSNPQYLICRTRLEREFQTDCEPPSRYSGPSTAYDCYRLQNWPADSVINISEKNSNEEEYCGPTELLERFTRELELLFPGKLKQREEYLSRSRATHRRADIPRDVRQIRDTSAEVPNYWRYQLRPKKNRTRARRVP